jgi:hypothetical protein
MAIRKPLAQEDITATKTLLHESLPITGTIFSGTYDTDDLTRGTNIKTYGHGMFQSVYDYPYLSSSANHIMDLTLGIRNETVASQSVDKANIYSEFAQMLAGYDSTASIEPLRVSGTATGDIIQNPMFISVARLLQKDEIQKGSFKLTLGLDEDYSTPFTNLFYISDFGATESYNSVNSPLGEFGILRSGSSTDATDAANNDAVGLVYYQAGIVVLDMSATIDLAMANQSLTGDDFEFVKSSTTSPNLLTYTGSYESGTIDQNADALRHRIYNMEFNNTTELNSTIYFCRAGHNEFNYSSNPTYLSSSQIRVKGNNPKANPISYITTVGLYSAEGALVAVGKFSEPLRKDSTTELTVRVRLDY